MQGASQRCPTCCPSPWRCQQQLHQTLPRRPQRRRWVPRAHQSLRKRVQSSPWVLILLRPWSSTKPCSTRLPCQRPCLLTMRTLRQQRHLRQAQARCQRQRQPQWGSRRNKVHSRTISMLLLAHCQQSPAFCPRAVAARAPAHLPPHSVAATAPQLVRKLVHTCPVRCTAVRHAIYNLWARHRLLSVHVLSADARLHTSTCALRRWHRSL